jgi:hypothetical protein
MEVHYTGHITKFFEPQHNCTILSFKIHSLNCMLKYKLQIKLCAKVNRITNVLCSYDVEYHIAEVKEMCVCIGGY